MINTGKRIIAKDADGSYVYSEDIFVTATQLLRCDECRLPIGWVYECDLNGSYFQCLDCKAKELLR